MKKILLIGSEGQLGSDLSLEINELDEFELLSLDHKNIELKDKSSVERAIIESNPDIIINCGAYVRVDDCEENAEEAVCVNSIGSGYVAEAAANIDAVCVYISTDYVFDGLKNTPYFEDDLAYPVNVYGISKLSGELMVKTYNPNHYIIRSAGLYGLAGSSGKGGNFVETIIKNAKKGNLLSVVDDQVLTPTFTKDLAKSILQLITKANYGTYHLTNSGECSWYLFAKKILELSGLDTVLNPISSEEYGAKAKRPHYSVLSNEKALNSGAEVLRPWDEALKEYISLRSKSE